MYPDKAQQWADRMDDRDRADDYEPTYRDGTPQNECWSEKGYTRRTEVPDEERRPE